MSNGEDNSGGSPTDVPIAADTTKLTSGLAVAAIIVGLALIAGGFLLPGFTGKGVFGHPDFTLAICVGFSLVLAAFGTRAGAKWRGAYVTGAGVVAVALFLLLNPATLRALREAWAGKNQESVRSGFIQGNLDSDKFRAIVMQTPERVVYGAYDFSGTKIARYQFEIKDLHTRQSLDDCIAITIINTSNAQRFYVPVSYLATFDDDANAIKWKSRESIIWKYDGKNIFSEKNQAIASQNCGFAAPIDKPLTQSESNFSFAKLFSINAAAKEATPKSGGNAEPASGSELQAKKEPTFREILADFQSENPLKQIGAQKSILQLGAKILTPLTEWFQSSNQTEKEKVQFLTIISLISNQGGDKFASIIKPYVIQELPLFSKLVVDDSKSVRTMATSLLYNSLDSSHINQILAIYRASTTTPEKRLNLALIVSGIYDRSDQKQRKMIIDALRPLLTDANAPALFRILVSSFENNRDGQTKVGWVFIGSLDDPQNNKWGAKYFDLGSNKVPKVGDFIRADAKVNMREDVIQYTSDKGWVNKPAIATVQPSEKYLITNALEVVDGYWWAQVRQAK